MRKKLLSIVLAFSLTLGMGVPVMAEDGAEQSADVVEAAEAEDAAADEETVEDAAEESDEDSADDAEVIISNEEEADPSAEEPEADPATEPEAEEESAANGECGDELTWTETAEGLLTISGTGAMTDYDNEAGEYAPWFADLASGKITKIVIEEGVTTIGNYAFSVLEDTGDGADISVSEDADDAAELSAADDTEEMDLSEEDTTVAETAAAEDGEIELAEGEETTGLDISLASTVTSIGGYAFAGQENLKQIDLSDAVSFVGTGAFLDCQDLTTVTIPDTLILVDENAFSGCDSLADVYYDGSEEEWAEISVLDGNESLLNASIHYGKDSSISTAEAGSKFTWGRDNWSFNNSSSEGSFAESSYLDQMAQNYVDFLKTQLTNKEYEAAFDPDNGSINESWSGSCYGMAVLVVMACKGLFPVDQYQALAEKLNDLECPTSNKAVSSLITYYYLMQEKEVIQQQNRKVPLRSNQENIQQIISLLKENNAVMLNYKKTGWGAHAVVAYDYEYGSFTFDGTTYRGCIKIWDPNESMAETKEVNIYFNTQNYDWIIPEYPEVRSIASVAEADAKFTYIGADANEMNSGGYLSGTTDPSIEDYVARLDASKIAPSHSIFKVAKNDLGQYEKVGNYTDDIIEETAYRAGDDDKKGTYGYTLLDNSSCYEVTQEGEEQLSTDMSYDNCHLYAVSSQGKSAIFDKSGYVEVNGTGSDAYLSMTYNDNCPMKWFSVSVSLPNANRASLTKTDQGYLLYGDSLKNVVVNAYDKEEKVKTAFTATGTTVLICEKNGKLKVYEDLDEDGIYDDDTTVKAAQVITGKKSYNAVYGGTTFLIDAVSSGDGELSYTSSDTSVVTVSKNGIARAKGVGTATITVYAAATKIYKGKTFKATVRVYPPTTKLTSLTAVSKGFTASWEKHTKQVDGYQIQYATDKKFTTAKAVKVKNAKTLTQTISNLNAKTKYYVRVRTYKTVSGKNYNSDWSDVMTVKTKA